MKKTISLVLAFLLCLALFAGCSGGNSQTATTAASTTAAATAVATTTAAATATTTAATTTASVTTTAPVSESAPVELNIITMYAEDDEKFYSTPAYEEITRLSGVRLTSTYVDTQKLDVILAGGDTTDLIAAQANVYYKTMATGGLIMKLNDLIEQHGNALKSEEKSVMWDMLKSNYDDGSDGIYGVLNSIGLKGGNARPTNSGFYTNWEYFKEIGAPEIKDFADFTNVLEQIQTAHPTTADGNPIYAYSLFNVDGDLYPFTGPFQGALGYRSVNPFIATRFEDNALCYYYLDEESPYWTAARVLNDAWNRGLVDPDSFTQTNSDYTVKMENGQLLTSYYAASYPGWEIIPVKDTYVDTNLFDIGQNAICIAETCSDSVAAIKFLDFFATPEAARIVYSGIEGTNWEYNADGIPVFTDETKAAIDEGKEAELGVDNYIFYSLIGVARGVTCADGYVTDLMRTDYFFANGLNDNGKDFCAFYSDLDGKTYSYPTEVLYAHGVKDGSTICAPVNKGMGTAPEDIARIDSALLQLAINAVPQLVMASPDDFESVRASVLDSFEKAGVQKSYEYWQSRWQTLADQYLN